SKRTWNSLSKDDQALLKKTTREAQAEERVLWAAYEKQAMEKARANGVQVVEAIDKQPFQDAVKPVWDKYGPRFAELIKRVQAADCPRRSMTLQSLVRSLVDSLAPALRRLVDLLYAMCVVIAGTALVLISAVIPWAVYTRYVLNRAASWPEPMAVLLMIVLTF